MACACLGRLNFRAVAQAAQAQEEQPGTPRRQGVVPRGLKPSVVNETHPICLLYLPVVVERAFLGTLYSPLGDFEHHLLEGKFPLQDPVVRCSKGFREPMKPGPGTKNRSV